MKKYYKCETRVFYKKIMFKIFKTSTQGIKRVRVRVINCQN